jgi:tetratricopeptide (TPR) repeat protein
MSTIDPMLAVDVDKVLSTIREIESSGDYGAKAKTSSASGAYQFIDDTWRRFTKKYGVGTEYPTAREAPPDVQDQVARLKVQEILSQSGGDVNKVPLIWYTGNPEGRMTKAQLAANKGLSADRYQQKWLRAFNQREDQPVVQEPVAVDQEPRPASPRMARAAAARQQPRTTDLAQMPASYKAALALNYLGDTEEDIVADKALEMLEDMQDEGGGAGAFQKKMLSVLMPKEQAGGTAFSLLQQAQEANEPPKRRAVPKMPGATQPQMFASGGIVSRGMQLAPARMLQSEKKYLEEQQAEAGRYNAEIEAYNKAIEDYQKSLFLTGDQARIYEELGKFRGLLTNVYRDPATGALLNLTDPNLLVTSDPTLGARTYLARQNPLEQYEVTKTFVRRTRPGSVYTYTDPKTGRVLASQKLESDIQPVIEGNYFFNPRTGMISTFASEPTASEPKTTYDSAKVEAFQKRAQRNAANRKLALQVAADPSKYNLSVPKLFADGGSVSSAAKSGVNRLKQARAVPKMPKFQAGGEVEQMTVGTLPVQENTSPVDTAINQYLRNQSQLFTDPKAWFQQSGQRLVENIQKDPEEFALGFTGSGIAGITRRAGGNFFLNPQSNLGSSIDEAISRVKDLFANNPEKEKVATEMFAKKAVDFFTKRASTIDDELKRDLIEGRVSIPKNDTTFPRYLIDAAKKGDEAAMRDLEKRYDDMLGIEGDVLIKQDKGFSSIEESRRIKQDMLEEFKKNPRLIPDDLLFRLTNKDPKEVKAKILENPEFFSTVVEPKLASLINPKIGSVTPKDIETYNYSLKKFQPDQLTANEQEAISRGQPIYDISSWAKLFGTDLPELAEQASKMTTKELAEIDFATFVRRANKLAEQSRNIQQQAQKVEETFSKGKTPNKEWLNFGTSPFMNARDGFTWKQIVDPDATIIQGKALNNSIAGYSRYGSYGPFNNGRKALEDGDVELFVLFNKQGVPVTHVEAVRSLKSGKMSFRQVFGNGPRTGNVVPSDYLPQVKDLINEVGPEDIPWGLSSELRNYVEPFAKGGMVDKPLYDRAV